MREEWFSETINEYMRDENWENENAKCKTRTWKRSYDYDLYSFIILSFDMQPENHINVLFNW